MSNICNGRLQLQQQASKSKIVSLTPLGGNNKMIQLVSLLIAVVVIATLLESPAASGLGELSQARQTDQQIEQTPVARQQQISKLHQRRRGARSSSSNTTATPTTTPKREPKMQPNRKRSSQVSSTSSSNHKASSKRFRGNREQETFISRESSEVASSTNSSSSSSSSSSSTTTTASSRNQSDVNNNNQIIAAIHDDNNNNNNTVYSIDRTRQVNSLNGTIDLSRYEQDDVDRLYSDALLVYVKNFNETLPIRRETLSFGGNSTSRVPIYKSDTRIGSTNDWPRP